eukprot:1784804-Prymnesium_polylepis.2
MASTDRRTCQASHPHICDRSAKRGRSSLETSCMPGRAQRRSGSAAVRGARASTSPRAAEAPSGTMSAASSARSL